MESTLFLVADYASVSNDGKLSVMGIFDSIQAQDFPAANPKMYLAAQFKANAAEYNSVFEIRFRLMDPNGAEVIDLKGAGEVPESETGRTVLLNQVVALNNLRFETPGEYLFAVLINGKTQSELPFQVIKTRKPSNQI